MKILVTGGTGYIGSHTVVELLSKGYEVVIVDNLSNSKKEVIDRIETITGSSVSFVKADIRNSKKLQNIFNKYDVDTVIHFAGFKVVEESIQMPLKYYKNNVSGSMVLLEIMKKNGVKKIIFSSSANVYGNTTQFPITEKAPKSPTNPYGKTKLIIESILKDIQKADLQWSVTLLRYFNPIGAHSSSFIGEDLTDKPKNLFSYINQVAIGKIDKLLVYGDDYPTTDGTGIRDYIHVVDLAKAHVKALEYKANQSGTFTYNLGTGRGYSVLEVIKQFEKATGQKIPYEITERRPGDIAISYADPSLANAELNWKAEKDLLTMCKDGWNWQKKNPDGYNK